jgi:hypothetical protein
MRSTTMLQEQAQGQGQEGGGAASGSGHAPSAAAATAAAGCMEHGVQQSWGTLSGGSLDTKQARRTARVAALLREECCPAAAAAHPRPYRRPDPLRRGPPPTFPPPLERPRGQQPEGRHLLHVEKSIFSPTPGGVME